MASDTPQRRYADLVPDGLTQIRTPNPPSQRGWRAPARGLVGTESPDRPSRSAVDATFENETGLR